VKVVISAYNVANSPEVGGHFWVYLQYALGLQDQGNDVYWLEWFVQKDPARDAAAVAAFQQRLRAFGLGDKVVVMLAPQKRAPAQSCSYAGMNAEQAQSLFRDADLLLNFHYAIDPELLARFRRTALVDIDPGLLQHWMHHGQIRVADHDSWFTTGETVGQPDSRIPDAGKTWHRIRPCVSLRHWPVTPATNGAPLSTVSSWQSREWVKGGNGYYENNKRVSFLEYRDLPQRVSQPLELALFYHPDDDGPEIQSMQDAGWSIRHSREVAGSPEAYRAYVQGSRGEFSCAKPSCMALQNAWVSDRTLCYLASGKPAVVQHTGPSNMLPDACGLFRFSTPDEAVRMIETVTSDYDRQCREARALAEACFDAPQVTRGILERAID
jgi:hypothetical protein